MIGFVDLKTPADLLTKLQHDLQAFEEHPLDTYAALNFFLTAEHLPDWWHPGNAQHGVRKALREGNSLLQVTSHLANSAKHFHVEAKHHQSVDDSRFGDDVFGGVYGNVLGSVYGRRIVIDLQGPVVSTLGTRIGALELARQIAAFWRAYQPPR